MTGTCLCGQVNVTIEVRPEFIHDCNCDLCRKSGGAWGYFTSSQVRAEGKTVFVMRHDKQNPATEVHSCAVCGSTTHFGIAQSFVEKHGPVDVVGVNMRLFDPDELVGIKVRFPDGRKWSGTGAFEYRRDPFIIGDGIAW